MRRLLTLTAVFVFLPTARAADSPARPTPIKSEMPGVWVEVYTDRAAFDARLGKVSLVNFDDIDSKRAHAVPFEPDRYKQKFGIVIAGAGGQFVQGLYWSSRQFPPKSQPNSYAPGPRDRSGHGEGGFETRVTFDRDNKPGAVAGFGTVFIAASQPKVWPCSLYVFGAGGKRLGVESNFAGTSVSQVFRGIVTVDDKGKPTAAIQKVLMQNSTGWPESRGVYGVTMDDFAFSPPVQAELPKRETDPNRPMKDRIVRLLELRRKGEVVPVLAESQLIHIRMYALGLEKSLAEYAEAEKALPNTPEVFEYRGTTYIAFGKTEKARAEYEKALAFKPRDAHDHVTRAHVLVNLGKLDDALASYAEALRLDPKNAGIYGDRAQVYDLQRKPADGLQDSNRAIELEPNSSLFYYNRGCHLTALNRLDQALADFTKGIEINPVPAGELYYNRGVNHFNSGRAELAIVDYTTAIELQGAAFRYEARAKAYQSLGQSHRASADFRKVAELRGPMQPAPSKGNPVPGKGNPTPGNGKRKQ